MISLVNEDDRWKLDPAGGVRRFDPQAFAAGLADLSGEQGELLGLFSPCFQQG